MTKGQVQIIDAKLLMAYQTLKDETCGKCGTVAWHGRTTDNRVQFKIESTTCAGCKKQEKDSETNKPKPGENRFPVVTPVEFLDGTVLPLPNRADYYERLHKEHLAAQAKKEQARKAAEEEEPGQ